MNDKMTETAVRPQECASRKRTAFSCAAALIGFFAALFLDQLTKNLAAAYLKDQPPCVILEGVFELRYLENRGAAFGMMQDMQMVFVAGAVLITALAAYLYVKFPLKRRFIPLRICAVLLCAGAVGNMIDRLKLDYVVDFFYFRLIDFPIFNVADCYVVVSCALFVILILFFYKDEDFAFLGRKKK